MNEYKNVMLISPNDIKAMGEVNINLEEDMMGASIRAVQNVYLTDVLGVDCVEKLQKLVYNKIKGNEDNIDDEQNIYFKTLLSDYISQVMGYKVVSELCVRTALKMRNAGIVQTNDNNISNVSLKDVKYLTDIYETYYNSALNRMMDFIKENKSHFPEIKCKKINRYGNINLYLG